MIIKNDRPVCTKYHYEKDLHKYYPTITLEHGPISLTVTWHDDIPLPNVPKYLHVSTETVFSETAKFYMLCGSG